ncbi:MAG TPA: hypothetical protein VES95_02895 [Dermatophilaceae bacterium]|nr:hypothetical protein [Dermatophilaceae bacterium]
MNLLTLPFPSGVPTSVPLLPVPGRVPAPVLLLGTALVLAGLDLAGALAAKAWAEHRSALWFGGGLVLFGLLFWVYGSALRYAELAEVTIAWIVILQVGVLVIDRFQHGVHVPAPKWVAVVVILGLEGYLVLGPSTPTGGLS